MFKKLFLAITKSPEVSLSKRWTIPGRWGLISDNSLKRANNALTKVCA